MPKLSRAQQYKRISFLGVAFMMKFIAFSSFQNIVSQVYEEYQFYNMGQAAIMCLYGLYSLASLVSSYMVKKLGYRISLFLIGLTDMIFEASSLVIITDMPISRLLKWVIVIFGAGLCGIGTSLLWTSEGSYVSAIADPTDRSQLFGLFFGFSESGKLIGNLVITFILGKINNLTFLIVVLFFSFLSSLMFLFLPSTSAGDDSQPTQTVSIEQEFTKIKDIFQDSRYRYLKIYYCLPGIILAFYAGFLYKLVQISLPQQKGQTVQAYNHRLNFTQGLVLVSLTVGSVIAGILMNRFSQRFNAFKLPVVGTSIVETAVFMSLTCYFTHLLPFCFISAFFWGCSYSFSQANIGALTSKIFPGKVQAYGVFSILNSFGAFAFLLLNILLSSYPELIFLSIIVMMQIVMTGVAKQIKQLDNSGEGQKLKENDDDEQII